MANQELTKSQQAEIDSAAALAMRQSPAENVRQWLQEVHSATLSTLSISVGIEGFPACSVVPFALDQAGSPFILVAQIAAHTRNLLADNRASLFIREDKSSGDPQAQWRATLTGVMERLIVEGEDGSEAIEDCDVLISRQEFQELKARYRERVPKCDTYFATHDFGFWRMQDVKKVRYIAGFGRICWFNGRQLLDTSSAALSEIAEGAIAHMNEDHADALEIICRSRHNIEPKNVRMTQLDSRGFFMTQEGTPELLYTSFGTTIDAGGLREAMVQLTRDARAHLGDS